MFEDLTTKVKVADAHQLGGLHKLNKDFARRDAKSKSIDNKLLPGSFLCYSASKHADLELLHARLGHCSLSKLKHVPGCTVGPNSILCDTCMMSKFHRLPFQRSNSLAFKPFELVHMDLWGPYKTPNISGVHYFLTVLDDYNRATWTFLLQNKLQATSHIKYFIAYVKTQFGSVVKTI